MSQDLLIRYSFLWDYAIKASLAEINNQLCNILRMSFFVSLIFVYIVDLDYDQILSYAYVLLLMLILELDLMTEKSWKWLW